MSTSAVFVAGMNREMPYMGGCMKSLLIRETSTPAYAACERSVGMMCFVVPSFSITKKNLQRNSFPYFVYTKVEETI